jgi:hypothetical protein
MENVTLQGPVLPEVPLSSRVTDTGLISFAIFISSAFLLLFYFCCMCWSRCSRDSEGPIVLECVYCGCCKCCCEDELV